MSRRATRIVAVCGDNSVNDRIGVAAKRVVMASEARSGIDDADSIASCTSMTTRCASVSSNRASSTRDKRAVTLNYVNVFRSGGLALLGEFPELVHRT